MSTTTSTSSTIEPHRSTAPTDYTLPAWFWDVDTTDEERDRWFHQERCRRQALRQVTAWKHRAEHQAERQKRRIESRPGTLNLEYYR